MLSYNSWQGVEMHFNKAMITDLLKGQMGFGGFVVTDYNGCFNIGMSDEQGLAACMNAGADMFMLQKRQCAATDVWLRAQRAARSGEQRHDSDVAPRRRRPPHRRRQVRDGAVRHRRRRSIAR